MFYPFLVYMMLTGLGYDLGHCEVSYKEINGYNAVGYYCEPDDLEEHERQHEPEWLAPIPRQDRDRDRDRKTKKEIN